MNFSIAIKCVCLWLSFSLTAFADDASPEIHFYTEVAAPYYWLDADGVPQGANLDLADALGKILPFDSSIEEIPWARACQEALQKPNVVLISLLKTPSRENQFQWLGLYHQVRGSLVRLSEREDIRIDSLEDAKQYRVGTIRGYGAADYLQAKGFQEFSNLLLLPSTTTLWPMLYEQRIDLVVANLVSDSYEIESLDLDSSKIEAALALPELNLELQMATGLHTPDEVVLALKHAINQLKQNGEFTKILTKWKLD